MIILQTFKIFITVRSEKLTNNTMLNIWYFTRLIFWIKHWFHNFTIPQVYKFWNSVDESNQPDFIVSVFIKSVGVLYFGFILFLYAICIFKMFDFFFSHFTFPFFIRMNKFTLFIRPHSCTSYFSLHASTFSNSSSTWFSGRAPRTDLATPTAHLAKPSASINRFYTVPGDIASRVISPFLTQDHLNELKLFDDFSLLVRKSALDVMACMESSKLTNSVPRFVLYGQPGCGISVQLAYLTHYAAEKNGLIFAFPNAENWLDRCSDFTASNNYHQDQHKDEFEGEAVDFPSRSAEWLKSFVKLNSSNLEKVVGIIMFFF